MNDFDGKRILVTGGTGSFGKTVVKALLQTQCARIRILSRDEEKQDAMRWQNDDERLRFYIGDVRDRASVDNALAGADLVFHAAALKQVPSCEFFPIEAVRTNVMGSSNVIESAIAHGVEKVVCLGTDKAVYPVNAMGMTKALMEKVAQAAARRSSANKTVVSSVRYGNVMYSRGSVIPLFVRQIQESKPLTITEPSMTRFMLPLTEAVELVFFALQHARQGDVFVKKAPACSIGDLATAMLRLFEVDNPVQVIGVRHGEKIYETLASAEELRQSEDMGDYYRISMDDRDLNYAKYITEGDPEEASTNDYHSHNARQLDVDEVVDLLMTLPEIRALREGRAA
ncbi:MAG: SDR family NAD(P)-dependent oxidoreductase [Pseudomonadota bacterium]